MTVTYREQQYYKCDIAVTAVHQQQQRGVTANAGCNLPYKPTPRALCSAYKVPAGLAIPENNTCWHIPGTMLLDSPFTLSRSTAVNRCCCGRIAEGKLFDTSVRMRYQAVQAHNPFRTAVPFRGQGTWGLSGLPPKRDCASEGGFCRSYRFFGWRHR